MTDEQKYLVDEMRLWYEVFRRRGKGDNLSVKSFLEVADLIEKLSADLEAAKEREKGLSIMLTSAQSAAETYKRERDQYWDYIKGMECESCSGDCDNCTVTRDGFTGWEWSGELSQKDLISQEALPDGFGAEIDLSKGCGLTMSNKPYWFRMCMVRRRHRVPRRRQYLKARGIRVRETEEFKKWVKRL